MNWDKAFENYRISCYEIYKWIVGESNAIAFPEFTNRLFQKSITEKGYLENEERALEFFDKAFIICYIIPIGFNRFQSEVESEYRKIVCNDWESRREATLSVLENALDLLQEREIEHRKHK